jgi:hypothetical protein
VAVLYGSVVEAIGLLLGKLAEFWIDENVIDEKYISLVLSSCSGLITILGIKLLKIIKIKYLHTCNMQSICRNL